MIFVASAANAFAEAGNQAAPAPSNFAESVRRMSPQPSRAERNSPLLLTIGTAGTNTSLRLFAHDCWSDALVLGTGTQTREEVMLFSEYEPLIAELTDALAVEVARRERAERGKRAEREERVETHLITDVF